MLNNWWPGTWNTRVIFSIPRGCSTHSMLEEKTELTAFSCHVTVTYKCFALCMNSCLWFQKRWDSIPFLSKFRHIQRANIQCTLSRYRHVPETASTKVNFETKCAPWIPNVLGMSEKQQHSRFRETEAMCSPIDMQGEVQTEHLKQKKCMPWVKKTKESDPSFVSLFLLVSSLHPKFHVKTGETRRSRLITFFVFVNPNRVSPETLTQVVENRHFVFKETTTWVVVSQSQKNG